MLPILDHADKTQVLLGSSISIGETESLSGTQSTTGSRTWPPLALLSSLPPLLDEPSKYISQGNITLAYKTSSSGRSSDKGVSSEAG